MILLEKFAHGSLGGRAIVENFVALGCKVACGSEQFVGTKCHHRFGGEGGPGHELGAVEEVALERAEAGPLVALGIDAGFEYIHLVVREDGFIAHGIVKKVLNRLHCLGQALAEAADVDAGAVGTGIHVELAGEIIHLAGDVLAGHVGGSEVGEIVECIFEGGHIFRSAVEYEVDAGDVVEFVLLVEDIYAVAEVELLHILVEVHEHGLDGLDLAGSDLLEEGAALVAVGGDGGDGGSFDLLLALIYALSLVGDRVVAVEQILVREVHDVLLRNLAVTFDVEGCILPVDACDEGVHEHVCAGAVTLELAHLLQAYVVDGRRDKLFVEFAGAQFGYFFEGEVAEFFKSLSLLGHAHGHEETVVGLCVHSCTEIHRLLLLVDIEVDEAGLAVAEDAAGNLGNSRSLQVGGTGQAPSHSHHLGLKAFYFLYDRLGDGLFALIFEFGDVRIGLPVTEVLFDDLHYLFGIEVAGEADGDIVRAVVGVEGALDVDDRRVLQLLLRAEHGLGAVRMMGEEAGEDGLEHLAVVAGEVHVILLINSLKFGVESADDVVAEAVGLYLRPVIYLIGGDILGVDGFVVGSPGVGAAAAYHAHHLVVLVGDGDLGCQIADGVDLVIMCLACLGIFDSTVFFVEALYLVEVWLFRFIVLCAELLGALEHEVLEVVGETGGLLGIVLASDAHCDEGLDTGLFLVDGHVDLEAVVKGVDFGIHGVARNFFVLCAGGSGQNGQCCD